MLEERLLAVAGLVGLWVLLRIHRRRLEKPKYDAIEALKLADELWLLATSIPPAHLPTPLRATVSHLLVSYADEIRDSHLRIHAAILGERSDRVLNLAKRNPLQVQSASVAGNLRRLIELLEISHARGHIDDKKLATSRMAANLSAEMAEIDVLCNRAKHAARYRIFNEARSLRDQAKQNCERLPKQTADRVRRVIDQRVPI